LQDLQTFLNVRETLANFLLEDIGTEDITSNKIIPDDLLARAEVICKSCPAIVCGLEEAAIVFDICGCKSEILAKDGSKGKKNGFLFKDAVYFRA